MALDAFLLEILRCPACRSTLRLDGDALVCENAECRLCYKIEDDIPIMLIDQAEALSPEDWRARLGGS